MTNLVTLPPSYADEAWKNALDVFLPEFMQFFYKEIAAQIAWEAKYEMLDKELQGLSNKSKVGKRLVDKLIKVRLKSGATCFVLLHIEVQGQYEMNFAQRLFEYFYRLYDRYRQPVLTMVVLTDNCPNWCPKSYPMQVCGHKVNHFRFLTRKLIDYRDQKANLIEHANPFGTIVAAHLAALDTRTDPNARYQHKFALMRQLYRKGLAREAILNLFSFIDGVLTLPKEFEIRYNSSIKQLEGEYNMRYITSVERIGREQGLEEGIQQGLEEGLLKGKQQGQSTLLKTLLESKFGTLTKPYQQRLDKANMNTLCQWGKRILTAQTLDEVF